MNLFAVNIERCVFRCMAHGVIVVFAWKPSAQPHDVISMDSGEQNLVCAGLIYFDWSITWLCSFIPNHFYSCWTFAFFFISAVNRTNKNIKKNMDRQRHSVGMWECSIFATSNEHVQIDQKVEDSKTHIHTWTHVEGIRWMIHSVRLPPILDVISIGMILTPQTHSNKNEFYFKCNYSLLLLIEFEHESYWVFVIFMQRYPDLCAHVWLISFSMMNMS